MNPGGSKPNTGQPATIRARLKYPDEKAFIRQYVRYVSRTELFIKTSKPKAEGTQVRFDLQIATGESVMRGVGQVAWNRTEANDDGPAGMSIKFQKLDPKTKDTIKRILALQKNRAAAASTGQSTPKRASTKTSEKPAKKRARRSEGKLDDIDSMLAEISAERSERGKRRTKTSGESPSQPETDEERPRRDLTERTKKRRRTDSELDELLGRPTSRASREKTPTPIAAMAGERITTPPPARTAPEPKSVAADAKMPITTPPPARTAPEPKSVAADAKMPITTPPPARTAPEPEPAPELLPEDEKTRPDAHIDSIFPPREAVAPGEPELEAAPGIEVEEGPEDEFDIDGLIENTIVEAGEPSKPLDLDSGYIAIKSLAPDMPGMAEMPPEEAIFNPADEVDANPTPEPIAKQVQSADDLQISDDAARLTDAFLDTVDHFGRDTDGLGDLGEFDEPLGILTEDDDEGDDEEVLDYETPQVDLVPARFGDQTTQLELGDETSDSLLDALASANADNRIGKDRLNSLIDEMTRESTTPEAPADADLLGTNDVSNALDEIFISVDGEEDADEPMGLGNAPMTLPNEAVPSDLIRPRPDSTGLELEELTDEDEAEKGQRLGFFKKLFGG